MQATVQAQDVKVIENWSLWEHTTKGNRGKQKLIRYVCEEAQNKSMWYSSPSTWTCIVSKLACCLSSQIYSSLCKLAVLHLWAIFMNLHHAVF